MTTWTALTSLNGQTAADALGEAMESLNPEPTGIGVFEVDDGSDVWEVSGYFAENPDAAGLMLLASLHKATDFVVSELPETDWVAHVRRELSPVEAGRFFVYGSHDADKVPAGKVALLIEAAMAFGTGHHATTLGCLKALDRLVTDGFKAQNVADIGCGTAVLAMAAAHVWTGSDTLILASDIDQVAVDVAQSNVDANDLTGRINCVEAAGFAHPELRGAAPYDLVFANILKGPLIGLAPDMYESLAPGGYAILSGILNPQADEVIAVYRDLGFNLVDNSQIVDWSTLVLRRV